MFLSRILASVCSKWLAVSLITLFLVGISSSGSTVFADPGDPESPPGQPSDPPPDKPKHPRLDSSLNKMVEQIGSLRTQDIASSAPISIGDLVAVTVRLSHNSSSTVDFLKSVGAIVANIGADYIEAYIPVTVLVPISERDGVLRVRTIMPHEPAVTSQGSTVHRSPIWNTRGYTGDGIKIGVIDGGFSGFSALMSSELPPTVGARCYTAIGFFSSDLSYCEVGSVHGTGVAEAIGDIAPDVSLYIANPLSKGDLQSTTAWMVSEGVQVINMSLGWEWDGPGDGTSPYTESPLNTVDSAVAGGVMWVNAAGNSAASNWYGGYSDSDSDGWLEFAPGSEYQYVYLSAGTKITVQLRWDDTWDSADSDLDLSLYEWDSCCGFTLFGLSIDEQSGEPGQNPYESITFTAPWTDYYYLFVNHNSGSAPEWFQLLIWGPDLSIPVADHSITSPGDSSNPGMLTVGAANWATPDTIESFSSRGPTTDGRIKPDIVGADRGDSVTYGVNGFSGTSQASPHVAGLAALVLQRFPAYTPQQVATYLKDNASGVGTVPNSNWGYGLAQMPLFEPTAPLDVTATSGAGQATVAWSAPLDDGGSPITEYTVTSDPGGVTATTTGTSVAVTGLTNGTAYTFTVTATNSIGTGDSSAPSSAVTPTGVPDAPTNLSATPGDSEATVSWTAPASDGGSAITEYTVISSPGGVTATTTGISVTVTGLTNGTSYTFTVTATNSFGTSLSADASSSVTPAVVPGVPSGVSAIPEDTLAVVSWTAPASNGGNPITEYTVTSDPGGVTATTASTSVTVTGLTQNTVYTFTVTATNAAGTSASSEPSPSVTTLLTNIWDAPSTSGWGLAALVAGMLVVMVIALGLTSGSRGTARP